MLSTLAPPLQTSLPTVNRSHHSMEQHSMASSSDVRTDTELLAAIAEHDRGALEVLYHRHEPWLTMRLARRCADRTVVDEVVQDTFVAIWRTADRYAGTGEVAAWIWGIGIRRLLQALRPRKPLLERLRRVRHDDATSAEEQVLLGIEHGGLADALGSLSPELRAVVEATILDGLTTNEAAELLGIPSGTVKTRMMRARREMRKALA
jgi:RNA polymerase sigma-70 factor (ECF subfamily)